MKLRQARKMDPGDWRRLERQKGRKPDRRKWWRVYNVHQLRTAENRLRRSWATHHPVQTDGDGRTYRKTGDDWFAANRVESRRIRSGVIRREVKAGRWKL